MSLVWRLVQGRELGTAELIWLDQVRVVNKKYTSRICTPEFQRLSLDQTEDKSTYLAHQRQKVERNFMSRRVNLKRHFEQVSRRSIVIASIGLLATIGSLFFDPPSTRIGMLFAAVSYAGFFLSVAADLMTKHDELQKIVKSSFLTMSFPGPAEASQDIAEYAARARHVRNTFFVPNRTIKHRYSRNEMLAFLRTAGYEDVENETTTGQVSKRESDVNHRSWDDIVSTHLLHDENFCLTERLEFSRHSSSRYTLSSLSHSVPLINFILMDFPDSDSERSLVWFGWRDFGADGSDAPVIRTGSPQIVELFRNQWKTLHSQSAQVNDSSITQADIEGRWLDWVIDAKDSKTIRSVAVLDFIWNGAGLSIEGELYSPTGSIHGRLNSRATQFIKSYKERNPRLEIAYKSAMPGNGDDAADGIDRSVRGWAYYEFHRTEIARTASLRLTGKCGDPVVKNSLVSGVKLSKEDSDQWRSTQPFDRARLIRSFLEKYAVQEAGALQRK